MPNPIKDPSTLTDAQLEAANQALMRERATILAYQRDIAAEVDRRAKDQRVAGLQAALAAEGVETYDAGDVQVLDAGTVTSTATVHDLGG